MLLPRIVCTLIILKISDSLNYVSQLKNTPLVLESELSRVCFYPQFSVKPYLWSTLYICSISIRTLLE